MQSGKMKHRVTFQAKTTTATTFSGSGGGSWANISTTPTVWAEILGFRGTEVMQSGTELGKQFFKVRVRYRTDITVKNRLVWGSRNLDIRSVDPDNSKEWLWLLVEEVE